MKSWQLHQFSTLIEETQNLHTLSKMKKSCTLCVPFYRRRKFPNSPIKISIYFQIGLNVKI
jgi:hypothetical protein